MSGGWDLTALVNAASAKAPLAERHLWLARLLEWLRHAPTGPGVPGGAAAQNEAQNEAKNGAQNGAQNGADNLAQAATQNGKDAADRSPTPVLRLRHLLNQLERHDSLREQVQGMAQRFWAEIDAPALFADFGFGARRSFASELLIRVQARVLPGTPQTRDLAALFPVLFLPEDADWLQALDAATAERAARLLGPGPAATQAMLLDAITILVSAVQASGYSPALRQRMAAEMWVDEPFRQLTGAASAFGHALQQHASPGAGQDVNKQALQHAAYLRALLDRCRRAAQSVVPYLEQYGVSVNIVFELDQLEGRTQRIEQLLECLLTPTPTVDGQRLLLGLVHTLQEVRGLRALWARHYGLLARQVTERSAETGDHYITRDRAGWQHMLRRAAGGGVVIAGTTFAKFAIAALGLSAFWAGFWSGTNYAASFVLVMLLHWTVATKQPAMTAPALAACLPAGRDASDADLQAFVDRVVQLIRSQAAAIVGNVALCAPLVLLVQGLAWLLWGAPLVGAPTARYVLDSMTLLGPAPLFAAFTGVLLFASSLVAGWFENWFVFHRLDSAIAWNPRIVATLGAARAQRWSRWWRANVSGLAANVSLGMMLGLVPPLLGFLGVGLEVRHVTLSSGQLGAALGALGWTLLLQPVFWWCVLGIAVTGLLNVGVSFWLAFRLALRSRGMRVQERGRIGAALRERLRSEPLSFVWPPKEAVGMAPPT